MRRLWIAWFLIAGGAMLLGTGVASGYRGLHNLDGLECPAIFASDRLVTVLTGKDPECDPTRAAQRTFVEEVGGSGVVALLAGGVIWTTRNTQPRSSLNAAAPWRLRRRPDPLPHEDAYGTG
jgi:hypothetical protein